MRVKDLIEKLQSFDPELPVIGYCARSEDDFHILDVVLDNADGDGLESFYNQGASCLEGCPPHDVVVIC